MTAAWIHRAHSPDRCVDLARPRSLASVEPLVEIDLVDDAGKMMDARNPRDRGQG